MLFSSSNFRATVMALRLNASFHAAPDIITCFTTENIIRGKTSFALLTKRHPILVIHRLNSTYLQGELCYVTGRITASY